MDRRLLFQPNPASRITILGRTGSGKTVLSKTIMKLWPRVLILDRVEDHRTPDPKQSTLVGLRATGNFLIAHQDAARFKAVVQFSIEDETFHETTEEIFRLVFRMQTWASRKGHTLLIVLDECQFYQNSHLLKQIILVGRRYHIATLCITQRPANLDKDIVSQTSDLFVGRLWETNDVKYLKDMIEPGDMERVTTLPDHWFLHRSPSVGSQTVKNTLDQIDTSADESRVPLEESGHLETPEAGATPETETEGESKKWASSSTGPVLQ